MTPSEATVPPKRPDKPGIIYLAKNKVNGKCYVGQTMYTLGHRVSGHLASSKKNSPCPFHSAISKYGIENFEVSVLQECCGITCLNEAEKWWIGHFSCMAPGGYNLRDGGSNGTYSEEARKSASERAKKSLTPEHHRVMLAAAKAKGFTDEHRKKISLARKGKNLGKEHPNFGKQLTDWHKQRVSETHKGKKKSEEANRKRSESMKKAATPELRALWSSLQTGKKHSDEARKKMSESQKARFSNGEKPWFFGKHHTEETKLKLSESKKGKPCLARRGIAPWCKGKKFPPGSRVEKDQQGPKNHMYGKHLTDEMKKLISQKLKGRVMSEDHKQKIMASCRLYRARKKEEADRKNSQLELGFGNGGFGV